MSSGPPESPTHAPERPIPSTVTVSELSATTDWTTNLRASGGARRSVPKSGQLYRSTRQGGLHLGLDPGDRFDIRNSGQSFRLEDGHVDVDMPLPQPGGHNHLGTRHARTDDDLHRRESAMCGGQHGGFPYDNARTELFHLSRLRVDTAAHSNDRIRFLLAERKERRPFGGSNQTSRQARCLIWVRAARTSHKGKPSCPALAGAPDTNARQQLGRLPVRRPHSLSRIPPSLADGATRAAAT